MHVLVERVEEEDKRNNSVRSLSVTVDSVLRRADGLEGEEDDHTTCGGEEENTTADALDCERGGSSPEQIPYGQDTAGDMSKLISTRHIKKTYAVMRSWIVVLVMPMVLNT